VQVSLAIPLTTSRLERLAADYNAAHAEDIAARIAAARADSDRKEKMLMDAEVQRTATLQTVAARRKPTDVDADEDVPGSRGGSASKPPRPEGSGSRGASPADKVLRAVAEDGSVVPLRVVAPLDWRQLEVAGGAGAPERADEARRVDPMYEDALALRSIEVRMAGLDDEAAGVGGAVEGAGGGGAVVLQVGGGRGAAAGAGGVGSSAPSSAGPPSRHSPTLLRPAATTAAAPAASTDLAAAAASASAAPLASSGGAGSGAVWGARGSAAPAPLSAALRLASASAAGGDEGDDGAYDSEEDVRRGGALAVRVLAPVAQRAAAAPAAGQPPRAALKIRSASKHRTAGSSLGNNAYFKAQSSAGGTAGRATGAAAGGRAAGGEDGEDGGHAV
jgi:hypothetical protein